MFLHLGQDTVIYTKDILGVFDLDTCTISAKTKEFLAKAEKNGEVINTTLDLPKSFVVSCRMNEKIVYICQNTTATIKKRQNIFN